MPAAPRVKNLATRICYKVLGTPVNISNKRSKQQQKVNDQLNAQETSRVR